jgi:hypothetical protein
MRRRRKKRNHLSVSLFPFLAVLICTLGVLIVMLVMAVKSADLQAEKTQADDIQEKQSRIDDLQNAVDFRTVQMEGIEMSRPEIVSRLNESRSNRSYLENEIRKLKQKFQRLAEELIELDQDPEVSLAGVSEYSEENANAEIQKLEQEIESATSSLKTKRELADQIGEAKYVIVPHKGGGGTFRRPIFLECTRSGITLQPSGIVLETGEFAPPLEPGNMLDSALLAIREYWQRYDLAGENGSPYPLIVVRPDGAETFVLARRAMTSWDDEFGYELVESDKSLDFGTKDPQLAAEINDAIEEARRRQRFRQAQLAAMERGTARFSAPVSRPGLTASKTHGGFVASPVGSTDRGSSFDRRRERRDSFLGDGSSLDHFRDHDDMLAQQGNSFDPIEDADDAFPGQASNSSTAPAQDNRFIANQNSAETQSTASFQNGVSQDGTSSQQASQNPYAQNSLAGERGQNWALPTQTPGATGYLRPIRIICSSNSLEILSSRGASKRIPMVEQTRQSIDPLIDEIWKQIESWGISGANSYWKPQLRFTIQPGGQQRFAELKELLDQSGLVIEEMRR